MARPLTPSWPAAAIPDGLVARLREVPDDLWKRRGLLLLLPAVLTAAYVVLLAEAGIGWRAAVAIFARICVFELCIALVGAAATASVTPSWRAREQRSLSIMLVTQFVIVALAVLVGGETAMAIFYAAGLDPEPGRARTAVYGLGFVFGTLYQALTLHTDTLELRAEQGALREELARRDALEARLDALQARTNPHFLFNSLNTIAGLIAVDPGRAEQAIETLAEVMRHALDSTRSSTVPLAVELEAVEGHLALEKLRFGERLRTAIEIEPGLESLPVPPLCLQPVVENAVLHGIARREEGGELRIRAARRHGALCLRVEDDGPGPGGSTHEGTGTALRDLRARLDLLYGECASLEVSPRPGGGCVVELRIPIRPAEKPA